MEANRESLEQKVNLLGSEVDKLRESIILKQKELQENTDESNHKQSNLNSEIMSLKRTLL